MASDRATRRGLSVRWLLLSVNALILLIPVLALLGLKLYSSQMIRQTETKLIAESVLIGEAWRAYLLDELGRSASGCGAIRPADARDERYYPRKPLLDGEEELLAPLADPSRQALDRQGPAWRAGARLQPLLKRAQVFNLTSARVLDAEGCTVASTGLWHGSCLDHVPEVQRALAGHYTAVARRRVSDEPKPGWASISRRGDVRVFTALPVFEDGRVIGAVWMSRTSMDPLKAAWFNRRPLSVAFLSSLFIIAVVSLVLSRSFTRPLREITEAAQAIARGERGKPISPHGMVPAEIHTLGEALGTMTAQLADRADYIADFAANVSHELKSPITSIQGAAELLREDGLDMPAEQRSRFLSNIQADAARMERLVVRLLELARIQSSPESAEEVELGPFFERLIEAYGDGPSAVHLDARAAPRSLRINPDHLESAVRNLLDNAVRHGAGKPVELAVRAEGERVAISVRDRGPGVSPANRERVFERFFTTERDHGGTGLGLAIVQAVARTRGGDVRFESDESGTTFTLRV